MEDSTLIPIESFTLSKNISIITSSYAKLISWCISSPEAKQITWTSGILKAPFHWLLFSLADSKTRYGS